MIVVHCSGSRCNHRYTLEHAPRPCGGERLARHRLSFLHHPGRCGLSGPVERMGAQPWATMLIPSVSLRGRFVASGCISDTRTPAQKEAMKLLILRLHREFPDIKTILGHRDLPGMQKACPASMPRSFSLCWLPSIYETLPTCMFWQVGEYQGYRK